MAMGLLGVFLIGLGTGAMVAYIDSWRLLKRLFPAEAAMAKAMAPWWRRWML